MAWTSVQFAYRPQTPYSKIQSRMNGQADKSGIDVSRENPVEANRRYIIEQQMPKQK
jgi:hypothetical protein